MKPRATREQIDAWIDVLDRAEPNHAGWESAFNQLKGNFIDARAFRDIVRWPLLVLWGALAVTYLAGVDIGLLGLLGTALSGLLLLWWRIAHMRFPVLEIEERVAELLNYYGANVTPGEPY